MPDHKLVKTCQHSRERNECGVFLAPLSLVKNDADAEEVSQETFRRPLNKNLMFPAGGEVQHLADQISINEAEMKLRNNRHLGRNAIHDAGALAAISPFDC